ncbi:NAD(P)-dependent dehydrogenase (short-subunit alcohol dehydrogenase family) [Altererythrobacter atlanticus]|uniref:2,5-dichloro-2,5-cyclohexadiene-1,4-diol dehydrogenase n=1 Tax=Croceibacterium atlanticum TaxID=1267766 RepID=A0A0F7KSL8_9SPHN|nr:glucose 1-dehydrogenase [Croceibacterium atlanticum]AKH42267.1 2,5-dichloro-2,5-cyclohexadiene-1,4-diol dehydrogenase [Croceibacterium atlanticum]MBB5731043.1 NAD(P)-dependent dehydrogenase (short-subunit alcohol dehydrogenase family) [Croceibacterium atlanticum]
MSQDFSGKNAIVTGAASGIGAAIARDLAGRGARVLVADYNSQGAEAVAGELGAGALAYAVNVAKAEEVEAMVAFAVREFGRLDLAVNNAGISGDQQSTGEMALENWRRVIDVNLNGVFYSMRYQIPAMLENGGGSIVNMASILGSVGWRGAAHYVAAKHAVCGLTKTAALEYSAQGIRVNAVGPAFIETPLIEGALSKKQLDGLVGMHPIGRLGQPEEVAALTNFLLSDAASFLTGAYYPVDGAFLAQ